MTTTEKERSKYSRIWEFPAYADGPGAGWVDLFMEVATPPKKSVIIDFGAGQGDAAAALRERGMIVRGFDITDAGWRHPEIPLQLGCLWKDRVNSFDNIDYAYCCDVMEHIPTQFVGLSIENIMTTAERCFFSISFLPDQMGRLIGEPLHLTVKPFTWWRDLFRDLGTVVDARDMLGQGIFYVHK